MVVVIIEPALADGDRPPFELGANGGDVTSSIEPGRIVGMYAGGEIAEPGVASGELTGATRRIERFPDADERHRAGRARALDDVLPIVVERRIGEMDVAVDVAHESTNRRARRRFGRA